MAKPIAVQKLKHGKALCGKTFGGFVDTFNWLVDFCLSLKGDKDVNNANGTITVDRADPSAPIIRADKHPNEGGGEGAPRPFDFDGVNIVNCTFYWNGSAVTISDFAAPESGDVYLCGTQPAPSQSVPNPPWSWTLSATTESAPDGGKVRNFKLWTFADGEPTMDYRDTFLAMDDATQRARLDVAPPSGSQSIALDATGSGGNAVIATKDIPSGKTLSVRTITLGSSQSENVKILGTTDFSIPNYVAGNGITITTVGNTKTISASSGASTTTVDVVTDVAISYDSENNAIVLTCARKTLTVLGATNANDATDSLYCAAQDVVTDTSYSTSTHKFTQTKATIHVPSAGQGTDSEVFTATPHSAEH